MAYGRAWRKEVMVMAAVDYRRPLLDLYQLLGVARAAGGGEIARAWRRRALAEHPDRRPGDAAAPARFRALAEAYRVLGDPARRAAYDRSLGDQPGTGTAVPGSSAGAPGRQRQGDPGVTVGVRLTGRVPEPPVRADPVAVERPGLTAVPRTAGDGAARPAGLEELAVWYLAGGEGWPW
jgi:DnaJ domain